MTWRRTKVWSRLIWWQPTESNAGQRKNFASYITHDTFTMTWKSNLRISKRKERHCIRNTPTTICNYFSTMYYTWSKDNIQYGYDTTLMPLLPFGMTKIYYYENDHAGIAWIDGNMLAWQKTQRDSLYGASETTFIYQCTCDAEPLYQRLQKWTKSNADNIIRIHMSSNYKHTTAKALK